MNTRLIIFIGLVAIAALAIYSFYSKKKREEQPVEDKKDKTKKIVETKKSSNELPTPVDDKKSTFNIKIPDSKLIGKLTKKDIISLIDKSKIERIVKETAVPPPKKFITPEDVARARKTVKYLRAFNKLGNVDLLSYYDMIVDIPLALWIFSEPAFDTKSMRYLQINEVDYFLRLPKEVTIRFEELDKFKSYLQDWDLENTANLGFNRAAFKPSNSFKYPFPEGFYKWIFYEKPLKPTNRIHPSFAKIAAANYIDTFHKPIFKPHYINVVYEDSRLTLYGENHLYCENILAGYTNVEIDNNNFFEGPLGTVVLFAASFALNYFASYLVAIAMEYAKQLANEIMTDSLKELVTNIVKQGQDVIGKLKDQLSDYASGYGLIIQKAAAYKGIASQSSSLYSDLVNGSVDAINAKIRKISTQLLNSTNEKDFDFYNRVLLEFPTLEVE